MNVEKSSSRKNSSYCYCSNRYFPLQPKTKSRGKKTMTYNRVPKRHKSNIVTRPATKKVKK